MYPRTAEERARNRHSGFVCFRNRQDALDAMTACQDRDIFGQGHRLKMNWGRRVEMSVRSQASDMSYHSNVHSVEETKADASNATFDPKVDGDGAIRVVCPPDPLRMQLISTVASFVAKDGAQLEQHLLQQHHASMTHELAFLEYPHHEPQSIQSEEHVYYKWRVFSFAHGDSWHVWKTDPFQMLAGGCYWIPPPLELAAARREQETKQAQQQELERQKQQRRMHNLKQNMLTGRQLENMHSGNAKQLSDEDILVFHRLTRDELCGSRESILQAMAFFFEKSAAADHIMSLLRELLVETASGEADVDMVIGRIYLLSDVLFNSQQPGVKNAFRYRDGIERLAPDVFDSLHRYGQGVGRMTLSKLARAIRNVLVAWQQWEVFHEPFLQELRARFDGQDIQKQEVLEHAAPEEGVSAAPLGRDTNPCLTHEVLVDAEPDDVDGEPFDEEYGSTDSVDGQPLDGDGDFALEGEPLESFAASQAMCGTSCDDESVDGTSLDGEPVEERQLE